MNAAAQADQSNMRWDYWYVVSDTRMLADGSGGTQELLTYVTPEPGTLILLDTGLVAVFGAAVVARRMA